MAARIPTVISPDGFCLCGCGQRTRIIKGRCIRDGVEVWPKGSYRAFVGGHGQRMIGTRSPQSIIDRITSKTKPGPNGCIEWTGFKEKGYGALSVNKHWTTAHRAMWIAKFGPVPDGWHVDHVCRNRACVNTDHLEPVPAVVNTMRGVSPAAVNKRKTHCKRGHEFTPENTAHPRSRPHTRECLACRALKTERARARRQAARG